MSDPANEPAEVTVAATTGEAPKSKSSSRRVSQFVLWVAGTALSIYLGTVFQSWWSAKKALYTVGSPLVLADRSTVGSKLQLLWGGVPIDNVCVTSLAFWNAGETYIDASDLSASDPLRIVPSNPVRILESRLVSLSRPKLPISSTVRSDSQSRADFVEVKLHDDALEKSDGGQFTLFFSGLCDTEFSLLGRVKGTTSGFTRYFPPKRSSDTLFTSGILKWHKLDWSRERLRALLIPIAIGFGFVVGVILLITKDLIAKRRSVPDKIWRFKLDDLIVYTALTAVFICGAILNGFFDQWFDAIVSPPGWVKL